MPGVMFQDVVCSRAKSTSRWYTVPLSFLVHTFVLAALIVAPLVATDLLPKPRAIMQFVTPYVPVVPPAPPPARPAPPSAVTPAAPGIPLVAPEAIGVETGMVFEPDNVATAGIDGLFTGGVGHVIVDAPPMPLPPAAMEPLKVGGIIKPPARTRYVAPVYPEIARNARVQGVVILEAIIGAGGKVEQVRVLRSQPLLDEAALDAVRAWEYVPTLLNGQPTPVIMTVTVQFRLSQ
jgi:protein TonB